MKAAICNYCGRMIDREFSTCRWCGKELRSYRDISKEDEDLTEKELTELWLLFGDVPINDNDQIEEEFIGYEAGTNRFDIWEWFDERYEGGVHRLLYEAERLFRRLQKGG